jgi:hypothetical protein
VWRQQQRNKDNGNGNGNKQALQYAFSLINAIAKNLGNARDHDTKSRYSVTKGRQFQISKTSGQITKQKKGKKKIVRIS